MNIPGDIDGTTTLETIRTAGNFNRWMYDTIKVHCKGKILEIGSGIGNISKYFLDDGYNITLSDHNPSYCGILKNLSRQYDNKPEIIPLDIIDGIFDQTYSPHFGKYDCIVMVNVLEHIRDERSAIVNCVKLLAREGSIIILVPAFASLHNGFDRTLGHYRRYTRGELESLLRECRCKIEHSQYFNVIGIVGWFLFGKVLGKKLIPNTPLRLYNSLVGFSKLIDRVVSHRCGLSVIAVGKKHVADSSTLPLPDNR